MSNYKFFLFFSFPFFLHSLGRESIFFGIQDVQKKFISHVKKTHKIHKSCLDEIIEERNYKVIYKIKNCPDYFVSIVSSPFSKEESREKISSYLKARILQEIAVINTLKKHSIKTVNCESLLEIEGSDFKNDNDYGILMKDYNDHQHIYDLRGEDNQISLQTFQDFYRFLKITHDHSLYINGMQFLLNNEGELMLINPSSLYLPNVSQDFTDKDFDRLTRYQVHRFQEEINLLKRLSLFFNFNKPILNIKIYDIYKQIISVIFDNPIYCLKTDHKFLDLLACSVKKGGLHKDLALEVYQKINIKEIEMPKLNPDREYLRGDIEKMERIERVKNFLLCYPVVQKHCSGSIHTAVEGEKKEEVKGSIPFSRGVQTAIPFSPFPVFKHSKVDVFQQQPVFRTPSVNSHLQLSVFKHPWEKKLLFPLSKGGTFRKILGPLTFLGGSYLMFHNKKTFFQPVQLRDNDQMIQASS